MLQTLLLIEAPITPAEILSMVNMDTTLSSVLSNTQQQLPRCCLPTCVISVAHRIRTGPIMNAQSRMLMKP